MKPEISPEQLPTVFTYHPEYWDYVDRFTKWHGAPFPDSPILSKSLRTITDHRNKFRTLADRANLLIPEIVEERKLLNQTGYSNCDKVREFTAIIETLVCEIYSCLDGLRDAIHSIYENVRGVQKKSTGTLFKKAAEESYGEGFPLEIATLLKAAYESWFIKLRELRSELTHGNLGICSMQDEEKIVYIHHGISLGKQPLIIDDIIAWLNTNINQVNVLLNDICKFWFNQLEPREVLENCGIHKGRFMGRVIMITEPIDQDSGLCIFRHFYEEYPEFACPIKDSCAAYARVGSNSREVVERLQ
ncbi:MAG TPA: hypothetical protein VK203_14075 [Nostocaceae cyanobacterium]|nr:hypothetical protein [Nostocaceae cyanobacterium]